MDVKKKKILFLFFISLMFLPLIEMNIGFIEFEPLKGAFTLTEKPDSIKENWFSEKYQTQYDKYFNDHLGFRNFFVRLNNQIKFSFFDIIRTKLTVLGKNQQLFQSDYIDAYLGYDFIGEKRIQENIKKLDFIQKKLKKLNIDFLLIFFPGKASFMPENIPSIYDITKKGTTNYQKYISYLQNTNINFIDLRKYFTLLKDTSSIPIYPINGTHWSGYASTLASDTISKYISKLLNIQMVKTYDKGGTYTKTDMRWSDNDLSKPMNIFYEKENKLMYYPDIVYNSNKSTQYPNALFIGDSYIQSFYMFYPYFKNCYGYYTSYWNYNTVVKWEKGQKLWKRVNVKDIDAKEEMLSKDIIIIAVTQPNIKYIDKLLTDRLYFILKETDDNYISEYKIQIQIDKIKKNKKWFNKIKEQSKMTRQDVNELLRKNAKYFIVNK